MRDLQVIILTAGKGSRFRSQDPKFNKCIIPIIDQPALSYTFDALKSLDVKERIIVCSPDSPVKATYPEEKYRIQEQALGTGDAIKSCLEDLLIDGVTLILPGDCPTITSDILSHMYKQHLLTNSDITFLTMLVEPNSKYGKIVLDKDDRVVKIVEQKDATAKEKRINIGNSGIYLINNEILTKYIPLISNKNAQGEFYLTDIISLAIKDNRVVKTLLTETSNVTAYNDRVELEKVRVILQKRILNTLMLKGVTIENPDHVTIGSRVTIEADSIVSGSTKIIGQTRIGKNNRLLANVTLENVSIGDDNTIEASHIVNSSIGSENIVGPFARIRGNSKIHSNCRIGNFVEFKNVIFRSHSKCAHLTYLGDADVGKNVNIGCGVVTANYDRVSKWRTSIGDNAFIGSNSVIIAPVNIGDNALVAAGSTITSDVKDNDMGIARSAQMNYENYSNKLLEKALAKAKKK